MKDEFDFLESDNMPDEERQPVYVQMVGRCTRPVQELDTYENEELP